MLEKVEPSEASVSMDVLADRYKHRVEFFTRMVQRKFGLGARWSDELASAGYWGLFKALRNRREGCLEQEFSAYVSLRIHGAVIDEARLCLTRDSRHEVLASPIADPDEDGPGLSLFDFAADVTVTPEEQASLQGRREQIVDALGLLKPEQRQMLEAYMSDSSMRDIALASGVSEVTVRQRFEKASRALRAKVPNLRGVLRDEEYC